MADVGGANYQVVFLHPGDLSPDVNCGFSFEYVPDLIAFVGVRAKWFIRRHQTVGDVLQDALMILYGIAYIPVLSGFDLFEFYDQVYCSFL